MTPDAAQTEALRALGWLVGQDEVLDQFLGMTGGDLADLRARAGDPDLHLAVMDFLLQDEPLLIQACTDLGWAPDTALRLRGSLPGGEDVHWT